MKIHNKASMAALAILVGFSLPAVAFADGAAPRAALLTVNLRSAANFVILTKSGISTTGTTAILGNIGVSPIAGTAITGFALKLSSTGTFATSARVTGRVYAASFAAPTPALMTAAVGDMQIAYNDAAGRKNPTATELGAGNIGGRVIRPGLYKWSSSVIVPTNVTLYGSASAIWIFQVAGTLTIASGKRIILAGGALPKNVFWQVAGQTIIGTTAVFSGVILDKTAIVMKTGATLNGRAYAQTAVTLDANSVNQPWQ